MGILGKIFGDANERYIKSLQPIIDEINELEKEFEGLSADQLKEKTAELNS
jgi:preprotein translocase subunit SecA